MTKQRFAKRLYCAAQLKALVGKEISVKVDEVACAQDAEQMSEAVVTKWSVVKH